MCLPDKFMSYKSQIQMFICVRLICLIKIDCTYPGCDEEICKLEMKIKIVHNLYILTYFRT